MSRRGVAWFALAGALVAAAGAARADRGAAALEVGTGGLEDNGSEVTVVRLGVRGAVEVHPRVRLLAAFAVARVHSDVGRGDALGNARLGAMVSDAIAGRAGTTRRSLALTLTLPTASGQGYMNGAARAAVDAATVDDLEAFAPHAAGVALDGVHRVEVGPRYVQVELGAHLLRSSSGVRPPFTSFAYAALPDDVVGWARTALAAGTPIAGPVRLAADVTALVPVRTGHFDADRVLITLHATPSVVLGRTELAVEVRKALREARPYGSDLGVTAIVGVRW